MLRYLAAALLAALLAAPVVAAVTPYPASFHTQMVPTNGHPALCARRRKRAGCGPVAWIRGYRRTCWAPLAAVLVKDHTVIVPDLRGMGLSDHPDTGYTKKNQAVDIAGVMGRAQSAEGRPGHT